MEVLHYYFLNEIDYKNLQEISTFKLRIALNIFKIIKREIRNEKELIKKLEDLSLKLFEQKISSKNELTKMIKMKTLTQPQWKIFYFDLLRKNYLSITLHT